MKIIRNNDFVMREIAGETFLIPVGEIAKQFNGMITLNGMSAFIWKSLENVKSEEELIEEIMAVYEVEEDQVKTDIRDFLEQMKKMLMIVVKEV